MIEAGMGVMCFEDGGRGHKPLEAEKTRKQILLSKPLKGASLPDTLTLQPSET